MEVVEFIESRKNRPVLLYSGYKFHFKRANRNNTTRWVCVEKSCGGSVTTDNANPNSVLNKKEHSCVVDIAKIEVEKSRYRCKQRAREELTPIPEIVRQEFSKSKDLGLDFVTEIPDFSSVKTALYEVRHKALGVSKFPRTRQELHLPAKLADSFLLIDDGSDERILAFSINNGSDLRQADIILADGTFKSCCRLFDQLYTLHMDIGSTAEATCVIPVLYALLPNRKEATYIRLFTLLKEKLSDFSPKVIKVDFEIAAIQAFRRTFPGAEIKGCNFHFNQAIWRKVQALGLVDSYKEDVQIRQHIRMCAALAHLPQEFVDDGWLYIMQSSPDNEAIRKFNDYFVDQWLENDTFRDMWNCCGERHRTTNTVEGWHSCLNRKLGKSHPNIYELVTVLKNLAEYYQTVKNKIDLNMPPPKRAKKYRQLDSRILKTIQDLNENKKTLGETLHRLICIVKLN